MSDPVSSRKASSAASSHAHEEQDSIRTPIWLPFVGLALLLSGAVASYLWIYPGVRNTPSTSAVEAGAGDAVAPTNAEAPAAPAR